MQKKIWKDDTAVSPVIATILMVAITVVLAGVLVVYMQQYSTGPGEQSPKATFVPLVFAHQDDGVVTTNGGGWIITLEIIQGGRPAWSSVSVTVLASGIAVTSMDVKAADSDLEQVTNLPHWYLKDSGGTVNYEEAGVSTALSGNEANINPGEFETVENAYFLVFDNDADGMITPGDAVMLFKDYNADGTQDIKPGNTIEFKTSAGKIGAATLPG